MYLCNRSRPVELFESVFKRVHNVQLTIQLLLNNGHVFSTLRQRREGSNVKAVSQAVGGRDGQNPAVAGAPREVQGPERMTVKFYNVGSKFGYFERRKGRDVRFTEQVVPLANRSSITTGQSFRVWYENTNSSSFAVKMEPYLCP